MITWALVWDNATEIHLQVLKEWGPALHAEEHVGELQRVRVEYTSQRHEQITWCIWMSLGHSQGRARCRDQCHAGVPGPGLLSLFVLWGCWDLRKIGSFKNLQHTDKHEFLSLELVDLYLSLLLWNMGIINSTNLSQHCCVEQFHVYIIFIAWVIHFQYKDNSHYASEPVL